RWRVPRVPDWACHLTAPPPPPPRLFPYTTLFRSWVPGNDKRYTGINTYLDVTFANNSQRTPAKIVRISSTHDVAMIKIDLPEALDRKSTRLNSSHVKIAYAVFCLKKKILHGLPRV